MKKYIRITLTLPIVILAVYLSGCEKRAEEKTADQLLTENPWLFSKWEERTNNGPWVDILPGADACETDAKTIFRVDNTYEINEGNSQCDPTDPFISDQGTWSFINNGTGINFWGGTDFSIAQLNENTLVISQTYSRPGTIVEERITYKH